ncbi:MAG: IS1 family transposase [Nitrospirae bacterium]|nr:IS1 family transposase [Nitrospirota bacterium]
MNKLPIEKQVQIIHLLVEGNSLRATSRIADVSINTVTKLLVNVGKACEKWHDENMVNIKAKRIQCDEIWSFVYAKHKNLPEEMKGQGGDLWTWVGIDADTKLVVSYSIGNRDYETACLFVGDLANRIQGRVQLTTDGLRAYVEAVEDTFIGNIDYAQLIKIYGHEASGEKRYSPPDCIGTDKKRIMGNPDEQYISTSYIERQNLTMRMQMRRFTRLTNAFSKKIENHFYAIALHFMYYNFCRIHKTLRVTPAMEAELTKDIWEIEDIIKLIA